MAELDMDLLTNYAREKGRKQRLDAAAKASQKKLDELEPRVLAAMVAAEVTSIKDRKGRTLYLQSELWVSAKLIEDSDERDYEAANSWLEQHELGDFVQRRFNVQTVSAWAREIKKEGELPADFENVFDVKGGHRVRVLNARGK